jgi:hypothetical protein
MSEDTLRAVVGALPGQAADIRHRLGLSLEDTYAALVRLHDQGRAAMQPLENRRHGCRTRTWIRP